MKFKVRVSVFGGRDINESTYEDAVQIGRKLARKNYLVFCGGGLGVMEAISKGVNDEGGTVVGILKGRTLQEGNEYLSDVTTRMLSFSSSLVPSPPCSVDCPDL